jgi:hypothetical protein
MGPRLREDDGIKANTFKSVIPAQAGTHHPSAGPRMLHTFQALPGFRVGAARRSKIAP